MTKVLYFDLVGGAAGDMLLAALLDLGVSLDAIKKSVAALRLPNVEIETKTVFPAGLRALSVDVMIADTLGDSTQHVHEHKHLLHQHSASHEHKHPLHQHSASHEHKHHDHHEHRNYRQVRTLLEQAELHPRVRDLALTSFRHLADAEAHAHGVAIEDVTFHEVGADDALADIVGVCTAFVELAVDEVITSPIPMARGLVVGAHGPIPLPAPAVVHLLADAPWQKTSLWGETVTPTGAALLRTLTHHYGDLPGLQNIRCGIGAGHRQWPDRPNVVRAFLGDVAATNHRLVFEDCLISANIDDMLPEHIPFLESELFAAGAWDVWTHPIAMKKGRTAVCVEALGRHNLREALTACFFRHSSTLGVRVQDIARVRKDRRIQKVETRYGSIQVKLAESTNNYTAVHPEWADCAQTAAAQGLSVRQVYDEALKEAWKVIPVSDHEK